MGSIPRTCWFDSFGVRTNPFAFDLDGYLYNHEVGTDDNGQALSAHIESSPAEISSGDALMLVDKIIPDATIQGELNITIESQRYPNASVVTKGPFTIDQNSTKVSMRTRGRQMSMKLESTGLGDTWSLGDFRVNMRTDGMR